MAWDKKDKVMMNDVYLCRVDTNLINFKRYIEGSVWTVNLLSDDIVVMEYIGSEDKNKIKIFEGHIVRFITKFGQYKIGFIQYYNEEARFRIVVPWLDYGEEESIELNKDYDRSFYGINNVSDLEIIGHIFDNPELLGK